MISIHDDPIRYMLDFENDLLFLNQFIGKNISLKKTGYCCLSCSENIEIFANGFCKKCFFESPMSGDWVMKPELSKAHLGIEDRDLEYEKQIQIQDHIVYLSKTSETKVGVTRSNNKTTRWIDQGAIEAIELIKVPNRYLAGIAEVKLKQKFSDKTNWRPFLKQASRLLLQCSLFAPSRQILESLLGKFHGKQSPVDRELFQQRLLYSGHHWRF